MPFVAPGRFHRLGLVVEHADAATDWLARTLGSSTMVGPRGDDGTGVVNADGARRSIHWLGSVPLLLLEPAEPDSPVGRFFERHGPGLHSLASEIEDLWSMENRMRRAGIGITGTNLTERHFFMHPRDTFGMLIEWTDTMLPGDPRTGAAMPAVPDPLVRVDSQAWVTAVVRDVDAATALLQDLAVATVVDGLPAGAPELEDTIDLAIGDIVVRLIAPRSPASRYATFLEMVGERLCSVALRTPDLEDATIQLERAGIPIAWRQPGLVGTDPAATLGLRLEWTA